MALPPIRPQRSLPIDAVVQRDYAELRTAQPAAGDAGARETPEEKITWQTLCNVCTAATADELLEGKGIGDYTFLEKHQGGLIGQGKFSSVYLALKGERKFAVKHTPLHTHHELIATRLLREAHILAQLPRHPNLVQAYETIRSPGHFYLVEEYLEGYVNLECLVQQQMDKRLDPQACLQILDQLVAVVRSALHSPIRIAHRDIKPENVLVHPTSLHVVLLDLGLSTHFSSSEPKLTTVCGSPAFWSPELWLSNYHQQRKSLEVVRYWGPEIDIWCIGVTLLRLARGKRFPLGTTHTSLEDIQKKVTLALDHVYDDNLRARIRHMLDMDSKKRMSYFDTYDLDMSRPLLASSGPAFKATSFVPCDPAHVLSIPMVPLKSSPHPIRNRSSSHSSSRTCRRSSTERQDPSSSDSRSQSWTSLPPRVTSFDNLVLTNGDDTEKLPPAPLVLAFANPERHTLRRALSFFKYALRCAGIIYRVVSCAIPSPPSIAMLATPERYAIVLHCVASLATPRSRAASFLNGVLQRRPAIERAQSARSSSTPPHRGSISEASRVLALAFYLGISAASLDKIATAGKSPRSHALGLYENESRRQRPRSKRTSRTLSPAAPAGFLVHISDRRVLEIVGDALSVGTSPKSQHPGPAEDGLRGRRASREADALALHFDALGLRMGTDDPLASPAIPDVSQHTTPQTRTADSFRKWTEARELPKGTAHRSRSMMNLKDRDGVVDAALGAI